MMSLPIGVKTTSGGAYDRTASPLYFIATNAQILLRATHMNVLVAVNEIKTELHRRQLRELCATRNVLLDSGIYNLAMDHAKQHGISMDEALKLHPTEVNGFNELRDKYYELATEYATSLWGVIELDLGGPSVKPETRAMIERDTGVVPMPVYHPFTDGWDYYDKLATNYDRICFGNLVKASPPVRQRLLHTAATRAMTYPYLWTHLLGVTPNEYWLGCPMRGSADSSSWLAGRRWFKGWRSNTMIKKQGLFPSDMWYDKDTDPDYLKITSMLSSQVVFAQHTVDALKQDTHACHIVT